MRKIMVVLTAAACAAGLSACVTAKRTDSSDLFNGRDVSGWSWVSADPAVKADQVWSARDGVLVCVGEPMGYLRTAAEFTHYRLSLEYRWAPGRPPGNSGIFGRIHGEPRPLPCAVETQLKHGNAGDLYAFHGMKLSGDPSRFSQTAGHKLGGDLCGLRRIAGSEKPAGEWNRVEVLADGPSFTVWMNGVKVNEATGVDVVPGAIGLQSEGGEVHFRNVQVQKLP